MVGCVFPGWECNASAPLLYTTPVSAGARKFTLVERSDGSVANQTYGATDTLFLWELSR